MWVIIMLRPFRFINEEIQVVFDELPLLEKKPGPPSAFYWRGEKYKVAEVLSEWHDYQRRGRMNRNMQPKHAEAAAARGSWGVGEDCYRVRTDGVRFFDLYYTRAPKDVDRRKGGWYLDRELAEENQSP
jgi:hypothetical protein